MTQIQKDISIEENEERNQMFSGGEPIWGTLEFAAREKEFSEKDINEFVGELNDLNNKIRILP